MGIIPGAAVAKGTAYWLTRPKKVGELTVAVLPLRNLTGDPGKQYLADKSTEALVTNLARTGALNVVSSTTTRRYRSATNVTAMAARLTTLSAPTMLPSLGPPTVAAIAALEAVLTGGDQDGLGRVLQDDLAAAIVMSIGRTAIVARPAKA